MLTQAIRDKAAELDYDPVQIHQWARNTIERLPTWGGIQNADLTLPSRRGNSMDIASLTIALLRAAQIPPRTITRGGVALDIPIHCCPVNFHSNTI